VSSEVAVVIPAYQAEDKLEAAVRSVQAQTLAAVELLVVDDGSQDRTTEVARQLGARCIRQENAGPGAARNAGVRATTAPFVAFLDADDWFAPEKLARQLDLLRDSRSVACCTDAWVVRGPTVTGRKNAALKVPPTLTLDRLLIGNPVVCSSVMVRREAFDAVGGFDENRALIATEDYDLWLRLADAMPLVYLDEPLTFYAVHEDSLSDNRRFMEGVDLIMEKVSARSATDPHLARLIRARRGQMREARAWDSLSAGRRAEARAWLREARSLGVNGWSGWKMWIRSFVGAGPRMGRSPDQSP